MPGNDRGQGAVLPAAETGSAVPFLKTPTPAVLLQILSELVESARSHNFTDLVMVHEHRGEPDGLVVCHLPYGPTAYFGIFNTVGLRFSRRALPVRWDLPASATPKLELSAGRAQPMLSGRLALGLLHRLSHLCLAVQPVWAGPMPIVGPFMSTTLLFLLCCLVHSVLDSLQCCSSLWLPHACTLLGLLWPGHISRACLLCNLC